MNPFHTVHTDFFHIYLKVILMQGRTLKGRYKHSNTVPFTCMYCMCCMFTYRESQCCRCNRYEAAFITSALDLLNASRNKAIIVCQMSRYAACLKLCIMSVNLFVVCPVVLVFGCETAVHLSASPTGH